MRKFLFLIFIFGMSCAAWAQNSRSSWANISALRAGQKIQIIEINAAKHSGTFVKFSETSVSYRDASGEQTIQKPDVHKVRLLKNGHHLRNTLIGGAVGAGAGAAIVAGAWENGGFVGGKGTGAAVGAGLGFVVGAVVGVLVPSHSTIYDAKAH
ncbi:MAG: hypothetical protein WB919_02550 [Candidatus Sulfotelmatobacter sp.]